MPAEGPETGVPELLLDRRHPAPIVQEPDHLGTDRRPAGRAGLHDRRRRGDPFPDALVVYRVTAMRLHVAHAAELDDLQAAGAQGQRLAQVDVYAAETRGVVARFVKAQLAPVAGRFGARTTTTAFGHFLLESRVRTILMWF